jgi:hypothetical protein
MVNGVQAFRLICLGLFLTLGAAHAKELSAYRTGDSAEETISTPVALDVIDAEATAAQKATEGLKSPAIFRSYPNPTNVIAEDFRAAFATTRALFTTNLSGAFGKITNADETVASPAFTGFVTAFNRKKIPFPISSQLAATWVRGDVGEAIETRCLNQLLQMMHRPIRPDDLPPGLALGETLRLAAVDNPQAKLALANAERGKLVTVTSVTTITRLRDLFRRAFPQPEQAMARGVGKYLRTNCELDPGLTQEVRERDTKQMVVLNHFDAGQVIIARGEIVDAKTMAVLEVLNEKLVPGQLNSQLLAQREQLRAQLDRAAAQKVRDQEIALQNQAAATRARNRWLLMAGAGIAAFTAAFGMWLRHRRGTPSLLPMRVEKHSSQPQDFFPASVSPQVAQILKDAVVQGLAAQRRELLQAQQTAAAEINALVHRLDELKAPMQERLRSYEERIGGLEKDLAERTEENRELLKLKIEMTRRQLEAERARNRLDYN